MKKIFYIFIFIITSKALFALPCGNPASPHIIEEGLLISPASWVNCRVGYEGNFVSNRRLKKSEFNNRIDHFEMDMNAGTFTVNVQNRLDLYAVGGEARMQSYWRFVETNQTPSRVEFETKYRWAWSGGARAVFFDWGRTSLELGGRYLTSKPKVLWLTKNGTPIAFNKAKCHFSEWQLDLGIAYHADLFFPYLGIKYSRAKVRVSEIDAAIIGDEETHHVRMKNRRKVGMMLGCGVSNGKYFLLNIEARLFDEDAASVTGEFRF